MLFQENIVGHEDVRFGVDYTTGKIPDEDLLGFDFCALGTSDHSIFTYGTFGLWGALLSGGDVIASKGAVIKDSTPAPDGQMSTIDPLLEITESDEWYLDGSLPNWIYLDTRNKGNITVLKVNPNTHQFVPAD